MVSKASISVEMQFSLQKTRENEKQHVFSTFRWAQKVEKVYFYTCFIVIFHLGQFANYSKTAVL